MIRFLLFLLAIYIVIRLIRGPKNKRKPTFKFRFGNFPQDGFDNVRRGKRKQRLEEIEEAEFEDITDSESEKEKKENKT